MYLFTLCTLSDGSVVLLFCLFTRALPPLFTVDFGITVPPLTELIKNLLGKYTEGQILKVSELQCQYHTLHGTDMLASPTSDIEHFFSVLHTVLCYST